MTRADGQGAAVVRCGGAAEKSDGPRLASQMAGRLLGPWLCDLDDIPRQWWEGEPVEPFLPAHHTFSFSFSLPDCRLTPPCPTSSPQPTAHTDAMAGRVRQPIDVAAFEKYVTENVPAIKTPIDLKQVSAVPT